ncbi:GNAT family N-acetyltransferase [Vibrio sagamiensis]|uniref:Ribosomal-protein-serine acetyltransferase n=1 Tax=Vibrio sagamiensis NBRC 104589 TaxID=1219064 RepID=A0A511QCH3_9VIBR|nr:GNAT family N-acetyltransferase [Vibrio sagamiensis]PNQ55060.1 N-acetyltransferase [Vibrio agarivorans]GEM74990.1 ribosomal-protein-serine acetyltransferase [Vibrio sagamiensis NBRC 104589]
MYKEYTQNLPLQLSQSLRLEPLCISHAPALLKAVNASRENLSLYLPWVNKVKSVRSAITYIKDRIEIPLPEVFWVALISHDVFIGIFGIKGLDTKTGIAEIAYWLTESGRGSRVIGSVLDVFLPLVRKRGRIHTLQFHCMENNPASIKIAQRAGAVFKEYIPHDFYELGTDKQLGVYELYLVCSEDQVQD